MGRNILFSEVEMCARVLYLGLENVSCLERSPHFKSVLIEGMLCPMQYMRECEWLERMSEVWARELLARVVFRGWVRVTADARREGWERERRAKLFHNRCVCAE